MDQYKISAYSITEKARSERLFMHYALFLACVLIATGTTLIVLGIGDHLDIIVKASGSLEARFINASPGFGIVVLGLLILALSRPRRLKLTASHDDSQTQSSVSLDDLEAKLEKLIDEHQTRELQIQQDHNREALAELKRLVALKQKLATSGVDTERLTTQANEQKSVSRGSAKVMFSRRMRGERLYLPRFHSGQTDTEKLALLMTWVEENSELLDD